MVGLSHFRRGQNSITPIYNDSGDSAATRVANATGELSTTKSLIFIFARNLAIPISSVQTAIITVGDISSIIPFLVQE